MIHTDSKGFYKGGLGMEQAVGHVDFYPNGGKVRKKTKHRPPIQLLTEQRILQSVSH